MKAINLNGSVSVISDNDTAPTGAAVLTSPVKINKSSSQNNGKTATIENARNGNVVVNVEGAGYRTYTFDNLSN